MEKDNMCMRDNDFSIKDIGLASAGLKRIDAAMIDMPVLVTISDRMGYQQALAGKKIAVCSHITKETAVACICLKNSGADVLISSSNPRSTQDDIAAALVEGYGISVYGKSQQTDREWVEFKEKIVEFQPDLLLDDGAEVLPLIYEKYPELTKRLLGTTEQTSSGVVKVKNMEKAGMLKHPVIAINSSKIKYLFDNNIGVGQTSVTSILSIANVLAATEVVVVVGYGNVGRGIALRMQGMGAHVIVCERDEIRALDAYLNGFRVMSLAEAVKTGSIFVTATGSSNIIPLEIILQMKNGAVLSNCGSGQSEVDVKGIKECALSSEVINAHMTSYTLPNRKTVRVLTDGRVTNIVGGGGNPAAIMDLTFSAIVLGVEYLVNNKLEQKVYVMPEEIDKAIALIKLNELDIHLNKETAAQKLYDGDWHK
ncbi:MAG: adenosylhomocysteinase [Clostridia bacterium]|nr:adenosylhomocysteinase [Clostridia bacterium]